MYIVAFILVLVLIVCYLYGKGSIKFVKSKSACAASPPLARSPPRQALPLPSSAPSSLSSYSTLPIYAQLARTAQAARAQEEKHKAESQGGKSYDKKSRQIPG